MIPTLDRGPGVTTDGTGARHLAAAALILGALLSVPLVFVVHPLLGRQSLPDPDGLVLTLQSIVVVYAAVRLSQLALRAEPRWMTLIFFGFTYVWVGIAGLAQVLVDRNPLLTMLPDGIATIQCAIVLGGMVTFDVCSRLTAQSHRPGDGYPAPTGRVLAPRRVYLLAGVSIATAAPFTVLLGGVEQFFANRQTVSDTLTASGLYNAESNAAGGLLIVFANAFAFVPLLCMIAMARYDRRLLRRPAFLALAALVVAVNGVFNNPISNARYWFFTVALGILFFWLGSRRRAMVAGIVAAFVASSLLLFPFLNIFRYDTIRAQDALPDVLWTSTDYGAVTDIGLIVRYVDRHGTTDGQQLLGALGFAVPRAIWPDKARNTYEIIAHDINFPYTNLDTPLWAEGYVDFGVAGALAYLALLGAVVGASESRYLARRRIRAGPVPLVVVLLPAVAAYLPIVLRGSLLQAMARLVVMVGLFVLVSRRVPVAQASSGTRPAQPSRTGAGSEPRISSSTDA